MVTRSPDHELVRRFQSGDRSAYAEIVRRYQDRVYSMCLRWLHDEQTAKETAQDVFLKLYRGLPRFRGESQLSTYLYRIVANHCKNHRQWRQRRHLNKHEPLEGLSTDSDAPRREIAHDGPGTDAITYQSEAERLVADALAHLDDEQRHIILLRDVQDLNYDEIADILEVPRGTVKSRLHRARGNLTRILSRKISKEDVI